MCVHSRQFTGRIVELDKAGIGIASATNDIVGFPAIEIKRPQISPLEAKAA